MASNDQTFPSLSQARGPTNPQSDDDIEVTGSVPPTHIQLKTGRMATLGTSSTAGRPV